MKKLKEILGMFKLSNLKRQVAELGGEVTSKNIFMLLVGVVLGGFIACYLLKLSLINTAIVIMAFILFLPYLIVVKFRSDHQKIRFNDTIEYMEQLIYSFHKKNKIRDALLDVRGVSTGNMKNTVEKMINTIDFNVKTNALYEKAFDIMQGEYNCSRMRILHDYLMECEYSGGDSSVSLNMLLEDIRSWSERTLDYQNDRKKVRRNVLISIFMAMLTCGLMLMLIPSEYVVNIVASSVYQLGTAGILIGCIIIYVVVADKASKSYLDMEIDGDTTAKAIRKMQYLHDYNRKNHFKSAVIKLCVMIPIFGVCLWFKQYTLLSGFAAITGLLMFQGLLKKNNATKIVIKELNKMFPTWVRNLVLYLQTDNVHVAIKKSYKNCPDVMKPELKSFIQDLANDPVSMKPYHQFLRGFRVPTLRLSINYLYSVALFGTEDMISQLDYLVKQNNHLTVNEEKIRNEDALAGISLYVFAPMVLAIGKLMLDMVMFLGQFMAQLSQY